jgi:ribonuclease HII
MKLPDFSFEKKLYKKGYKVIAGVDEVGKGCFAGPIVTGCVVFPFGGVLPQGKRVTRAGEPQERGPVLVSRRKGLGAGERQALFSIPEGVIINDSKKMRPKQREKADEWIRENALSWGIGEIGVGKINKYGMAKAAKMAFRKSISEARKRLGKPIDYLLSDAFFISFVPGLPARRRKNKKGRFYKKANGKQLAIINGDEKSVSIAAASIIAKVYRDRLMLGLGKRPKYRKYGWGRNKGYGTLEHRKAIKKYGLTRQHRKQFVATWISNSSSSQAR